MHNSKLQKILKILFKKKKIVFICIKSNHIYINFIFKHRYESNYN